jgi:hypothetical protein
VIQEIYKNRGIVIGMEPISCTMTYIPSKYLNMFRRRIRLLIKMAGDIRPNPSISFASDKEHGNGQQMLQSEMGIRQSGVAT